MNYRQDGILGRPGYQFTGPKLEFGGRLEEQLQHFETDHECCYNYFDQAHKKIVIGSKITAYGVMGKKK